MLHEGPALRTLQDAVDVMGEAMAASATLVVVPISRLDPTFFQLRTGLAGEILQKFVNYRLKLVILGDYSQLALNSTSLRDFIRESNRGNAIWFLADRKNLEKRLES
jgi:Domain of unknown function (DUF4180)